MDDKLITHDEALALIDSHIGERCYVGLHVERADREHPQSTAMVFGVVSRLENPLAPRAARVDPGEGIYDCGSQGFHLPRLADTTIVLRDNGLNFRLADTVSLRIAWPGSAEVGAPSGHILGPGPMAEETEGWSPTL
jgi:hypothetical protein